MDLLSDKALVGFLKVIIEVNRDLQLLAYRDDERLSTGSENGFKLRMVRVCVTCLLYVDSYANHMNIICLLSRVSVSMQDGQLKEQLDPYKKWMQHTYHRMSTWQLGWRQQRGNLVYRYS